MARPELTEVPSFYHNYIKQVKEDDLVTAILNNSTELFPFLDSIPEEKWNYRYAEGKWSIKDLVQHIIDAERIFSYRALRFARKDETELPGFEENQYAASANAEKRSKEALIAEMRAVRQATEFLFKSFDQDQVSAVGTANGNKISVLAIGFIVPGHVKHHMNIIRERYLG